MNILFLAPIIKNHGLEIIYSALKKKVSFYIDPDLFWLSEIHFNIIHIHWPEYFFSWSCPQANQLDLLKKRLQYWRSKNVKILFTRHNALPHRPCGNGKRLYDLVVKYCDHMIHLGNESMKQYSSTSACSHSVIPHAAYPLDEVNTSIYKLPSLIERINRPIIMVPGKIRFYSEQEQIIKAFKLLNKHASLLFLRKFRHAVPYFKSKPISYINSRIRNLILFLEELWNTRFSNIYFLGGYIENYTYQSILSMAELIISPRNNVLNSGVLILGLSIGKVTVAQYYGNMKEILLATGNPGFTQYNYTEIHKAMNEGIKLASTNHGSANKIYAQNHWNVENISSLYLKLYNNVINE